MVRNGSGAVTIKGVAGEIRFRRQVICGRGRRQRGKKKYAIPINGFFPQLQQGKAIVSKNLEEQAIETCLERSYRGSEKTIKKKLGRESIRRLAIRKGKQAAKLEKMTCEYERQIEQCEGVASLDAESSGTDYKRSKKETGRMRKLFGLIFHRKVLYLMADGVGVRQQRESGTRECKVGTCFLQTEDRLVQIAAFCTWERVTTFTNMLDWLLQKIFCAACPVVIISDGAKWIRNMRSRIPCLKNAVWILDWFHLRSNTVALLTRLGHPDGSEQTEQVLKLFWLGMPEAAISVIDSLPLSADPKTAAEQKGARGAHRKYVENQREGIIDYQAQKMKGYLVGSGAVEKMNDLLVKDRMVRQKRMRWGVEGGEAMMQLLTALWNGRLDELFA